MSASGTQAAGYVFDESLGRALPVDQEEDIRKKGNVNELPPSEVREVLVVVCHTCVKWLSEVRSVHCTPALWLEGSMLCVYQPCMPGSVH